MSPSTLSGVLAATIGVLALAAALLAWRERSARVVVVLLFAQTALLLLATSYFADYAAFVVPAAALTLAIAAERVAVWLAARGRVLRIAGVGALSAAVVTAGVSLVPIRVEGAKPFAGRQLATAAGQQRCVLSDTSIALIEMNVLSRDQRNGCLVRPDVTGYTLEGDCR